MPIFETSRGLKVTAESAEAAAAVERFESDLLALQKGAEDIIAAAEKFPATPLVQAYTAVAMLYAQSAEANAQAAKPLQRAQELLADATPRETQFVSAIDRFQRGEFTTAMEKLEALTVEHPRDLVAAKVCEFLYYIYGQHYCGERFLWHMMRLRQANGDHPGFLSMLSFAQELCGRYDEARASAERSLTQEPGQPWSHHTLAHVLIRTGAVAEGVREMERFAPFWPDCARGIHAHNAWHQSLFYLEETDWARAEQILSEDIWGSALNDVGEQVDAIALMWRLDLASQPVADSRWAEVAKCVAPHAGECLVPFLEGHFVYALARAGENDAVERAVAKARERAERDDREARISWQTIGADFSAACAAWGRGDNETAVSIMEHKADDLPRVGGSDAQDDLFRLAHFNALAGAGRKTDARNYYPTISPAKTHTALDALMLAKCN